MEKKQQQKQATAGKQSKTLGCDILRTPASWARGLMCSTPKKKATVFIFNQPRYAPIHNWFVFYSIDAYWFDETYNNLTTVKNIKPFTCLVTHTGKAKYLVETPAGLSDIKAIQALLRQRITKLQTTLKESC
jgi:uncharacterized membrane protein (UPF0127 family)